MAQRLLGSTPAIKTWGRVSTDSGEIGTPIGKKENKNGHLVANGSLSKDEDFAFSRGGNREEERTKRPAAEGGASRNRGS